MFNVPLGVPRTAATSASLMSNWASGPERIGLLHTGQPLVGSLLNASLETVGGYSGAP